MSEMFESIARGLKEAIEYEQGKNGVVKVHQQQEIDVAAIRKQLGFTQAEFAAKFCISMTTLKHWERGKRKPQGAALTLLQIVNKEPEAVLRALN
ncbi:MAG: NadS family protein [Methylococcales bacterium]